MGKNYSQEDLHPKRLEKNIIQQLQFNQTETAKVGHKGHKQNV